MVWPPPGSATRALSVAVSAMSVEPDAGARSVGTSGIPAERKGISRVAPLPSESVAFAVIR